MRYLEWHGRRWFTQYKKEASEALEILRQRKTLLRPAPASANSTLLRAAGGPSSSSPDQLLRASGPSDVEPLRTKRFLNWLVVPMASWTRLIRIVSLSAGILRKFRKP